jgi:hypothetical protein
MNVILPAFDDSESKTTIVARDKPWPDVRPLSVLAQSDAGVAHGPTYLIHDHSSDGDMPDAVRHHEVPEAHLRPNRHDDRCSPCRFRHARIKRARERWLAIVISNGVEAKEVLAWSNEPQLERPICCRPHLNRIAASTGLVDVSGRYKFERQAADTVSATIDHAAGDAAVVPDVDHGRTASTRIVDLHIVRDAVIPLRRPGDNLVFAHW